MQEAFLHYLWKYKKFEWSDAKTTDNKNISLISSGQHNEQESGPDFFNAKLKIDDQLWAGNVEIHLKASDWYTHGHETDPAYDNVILHVVWENDIEIFRKDNTAIPTLELNSRIQPNTLLNYHNLLEINQKKWINCENDFSKFSDFEINNWLERMYVERLEQKAKTIKELLKKSANNWEEVLFKLFAKNFGLNVNGEAFLNMAESIPFPVIQKMTTSPQQLEALLFGQTGMFENKIEETYFSQLKKEYQFIAQKFNLNNAHFLPVKYFRLRPDNFPTIRLAQLASLYSTKKQLFSNLINANTTTELYDLLQVETSEFWQTHYTFQKESRKKRKRLSRDFMDLLIINTVVPIKFCYSKYQGNEAEEKTIALIKTIQTESNHRISKFNKIRPKTAVNAMASQALIHLKKEYCDKNKCLHCALGLKLLQKNNRNPYI